MKNTILSKQPYKGTMDWYPKDMYARNFIFDVWSRVAKRYGYEEYDTAHLEDANLYKVKSGEELGGNQLYNFVDKAGREIALRPEMTPSLARMVANKKNELQFPLRWFNIGRYYRYEKPQKGRRREFFQLNIDILGVTSITAEIEIISFVIDVMKEFKAPLDSFELKINSRYLLDYLFTEILQVNEEIKPKLARALDNYLKMPSSDFTQYLKELSLTEKQVSQIEEYLNWELTDLEKIKDVSKGAKEILDLFQKLNNLSISNVKFCPYVVRGLAYYTGIVLELYDTGSKELSRSLFGGGRYDDLLEIFGESKIPAFGLGWGDVTTIDYLRKYNLLPEYANESKVFVCLLDENLYIQSSLIASFLRNNGINTLQQITNKKLSDQLKYASKQGIPWVVIVGEDEVQKGVVQLKNMNTRESFLIKKEDILEKIK